MLFHVRSSHFKPSCDQWDLYTLINMEHNMIDRSSCLQMFFKIGFLKNSAIFIGNNLCLGLCLRFDFSFYKGSPSSLRSFLTTENPLKNDEKCFLLLAPISFLRLFCYVVYVVSQEVKIIKQ